MGCTNNQDHKIDETIGKKRTKSMAWSKLAHPKKILSPKVTDIKFQLKSNFDAQKFNLAMPVKQITIQTHRECNIGPIKSDEIVLQTEVMKIDMDPDPTLTKDIKDPTLTFEN